MKKFELVLKNEKETSYRRIGILLLTINFISILFIVYETGFTKWGPLIISLIAAFSLFASFYNKPKNERLSFGVAYFLFSLAWQTSGYWLPAALNLILLILNGVVSQKLLVNIDEDQIVFPSFPKKKISWRDLSNLILKDGLLTIDFKNNRIIQQKIESSSIDINEKEFNEFCQLQLNK